MDKLENNKNHCEFDLDVHYSSTVPGVLCRCNVTNNPTNDETKRIFKFKAKHGTTARGTHIYQTIDLRSPNDGYRPGPRTITTDQDRTHAR